MMMTAAAMRVESINSNSSISISISISMREYY